MFFLRMMFLYLLVREGTGVKEGKGVGDCERGGVHFEGVGDCERGGVHFEGVGFQVLIYRVVR